ncbi:uncharacterized protein LOC127262985 isoform X2 [Andrographis paniculata]|uniref:uncharacterized protein LOC127262985 isoform X2 n=1 Tax=Andrographis paniculata TaxID=175694 RepID=UPI0021E93A80|nr:uncharacterized protein LOC127262985 isoform X2 [Andrographis paniculata]
MYGGSGKMGRGGGGGGGSGRKRSIHTPSSNRLAPAGRPSMGGGGGRVPGGASTSSPSTSSRQVEESFSLVRENNLNFGMAIKLAPDLVEEIKRVEAQGGTARIKFDANSNNPNGNVIHVGEKTFKFTWSREPGDFCDIYEERRSGEDGNGLLVESGATWRKLNVERELDESTKNQVKRRSEEAERKLKSRQVQVLDPNNPSMQKQMRDLVVAETNNTWRNFKHRKEPPFKKPKSEPPSAGGPPKSVFRSGLSTTPSKGKLSSVSPLSSQLEQFGGPSSPLAGSSFVKGQAGVPDTLTQNTNRPASADKETQSRIAGNATRDKSKHNQNMATNPADLRNLMISLLLENQHKGMNLKALEKAIGDAMPSSVRQIEPILKQIATFQAPGKYFLKPGVEMDSLKKGPPQSASSPEINHEQSPAPQKHNQTSAQDPSFSMRTAANDEEKGELNSTPVHTMDDVEKIDILQNSPEQFSDKKLSDHSEGVAGSSSDNGSDSESDSDSDSSNSGSENGSPSKSKSKSQSPVESRSGSSGSSSDSDSDASSSSKQASDEDVDIMTSDDEKDSKDKLGDYDPPQPNSPVPSCHPDNEFVDIENLEKQDDHDSNVDVVDSPRNSPEDDHRAEKPATMYPFPSEEGEVPVEEIKLSVAGNNGLQERQTSDISEVAVKDGFKEGRYGAHEGLSKPKSRRHIDDKQFDEKAHNRKKSKKNKPSLPVSGTISSIFGESPENSSPDRPLEGSEEGLIDQTVTGTTGDATDNLNLQTGVKQVLPAGSVSDSQEPHHKTFESHVRNELSSGEKRPTRRYSLDHVRHPERSLEGFRTHKVGNAEALGEDNLVSERKPVKVSAEGVGDRHGTSTKPHFRKTDNSGRVEEAVVHSNVQMGNFHKENDTSNQRRSPLMNGKGGMLRREYSDLELGEFREPPNEVTPGLKKQYEMKRSDKHLKSTQMDSECLESEFSKGKPPNAMSADSGKFITPDPEGSQIPDGASRKKAPENHIDDFTRTRQKGSRPMHQFNQSRGDHAEASSQNNKALEINGKNRSVEAGTGQGGSFDGPGVASGKVHVKSSEQKQHDPLRGAGHRTAKGSKKQKSNLVNGSNDRRNETSSSRNYDGSQKRKESSSDESCSPYTKYEKEEPELKGPIKDTSQYQEYVNEYQEKYEDYCSLNKILESNRNEFLKYGRDMEACKGRDTKRYNEIVEQMRASFRQCGERHQRLKKIYNVLHEELKHQKEMIKDFAAAYRRGERAS